MIWPQLGVLWMRMGLRHGHTWVSNVDTSGHILWSRMGVRCGSTWICAMGKHGQAMWIYLDGLWVSVEFHCGGMWNHIVGGVGRKLWRMVVGRYGYEWAYCRGPPDYFVEDQNCGSPAPSNPETRGDPSVFLGAQIPRCIMGPHAQRCGHVCCLLWPGSVAPCCGHRWHCALDEYGPDVVATCGCTWTPIVVVAYGYTPGCPQRPCDQAYHAWPHYGTTQRPSGCVQTGLLIYRPSMPREKERNK